jgi:amidase
MSEKRPWYLETMVDAAQRLRTGKVTSVELVEALLDRITKVDSYYKAYTLICESDALTQAKAADQQIAEGNYKGVLHGIPIALKDILQMAGTQMAVGSTILKGNVSGYDAAVVEKLKAAGAVILGKLNLTEFALSGYHPDMPVPVNPWNENYWSGVSSSGSGVATAAGLAYGTIGTDTGGSIRFPASSNGVVGIKPTFGTVSRYGVFPLSHTLDHIGPITRCVEDAATMLQAIAGYDARDDYSADMDMPDYLDSMKDGVNGMRIGVDEAFIAAEGVHPEVSQSVRDALDVLKSAGAQIVTVSMGALAGMCGVWSGIVACEAAQIHSDYYPSRAQEYGTVFKDLLEAGVEVNASDYVAMQTVVQQAKAVMSKALKDVDMIACPASPLPTGTVQELGPQAILPPEAVALFLFFKSPFNY